LPQDIRVVPHNTLLDAIIGIDHNIRKALATGETIFRDRRIDDSAVFSLQMLKPPLPLGCILTFDAIRLEHRGIDVLPGEMGVGPEHIGIDVSATSELCRNHAAMCRNHAGTISKILPLFSKKTQ